MPYTQPTVTESDIFKAIRAWIFSVLGSGLEVVQGDGNRVPQPKGPAVIMIPLNRGWLATNVLEYEDQPTEEPPVAERVASQSSELTMQLDVYGPLSGDWAIVMEAAFYEAADFLEPYGIAPLYCDAPRRMDFVSGENQYERRWMLTIHIQANIVVRHEAQFMDSVTVGVINVDTTYPPT